MKKRTTLFLLIYSLFGMEPETNTPRQIKSLFKTAAPIALQSIEEALENKSVQLEDLEFINQLPIDKIEYLKQKFIETSPYLTEDLLTVHDRATFNQILLNLKKGMPLSYHKGICCVQTDNWAKKYCIDQKENTVTLCNSALMPGNIVHIESDKLASWNTGEYHIEGNKHSHLMFHLNDFRKVAGIMKVGILVAEKDSQHDTLQILDKNTKESLNGIGLLSKIRKIVVPNKGNFVAIQQANGKLLLWHPTKSSLTSVDGLTKDHLIAGAYKKLVLMRNLKNNCLELRHLNNFKNPFYSTLPISNFQRGTLGKHDDKSVGLACVDPKNKRLKIFILSWPTDFTLTQLIEHHFLIKQQ